MGLALIDYFLLLLFALINFIDLLFLSGVASDPGGDIDGTSFWPLFGASDLSRD